MSSVRKPGPAARDGAKARVKARARDAAARSGQAPRADGLFFSRTWDFLERYLPAQANRSRLTVESYRDALSVFRRWLAERRGLTVATMRFGDCTRDLVLSFLEDLRADGLSAGTCNQRLAAIRSYVWYAADADVAVQSVALALDAIPAVRGPKRVKELLGEEAVTALIEAPDPGTRRGVRDRAIVALLYDSAIRLSELIGLDVGDVWLDDEPRVFVRGKGRKERYVAICQKTVGHLRAHLACMHGAEPDPRDPLFFAVHHGERHRMSDSNVQRIVQACADAAREGCPGIPERVHPHMLRRSRITQLYRKGTDVELLAAICGHEDTETTRVYAIPSLQMMRESMEAAYPESSGEAAEWTDVGEDEILGLYGLR